MDQSGLPYLVWIFGPRFVGPVRGPGSDPDSNLVRYLIRGKKLKIRTGPKIMLRIEKICPIMNLGPIPDQIKSWTKPRTTDLTVAIRIDGPSVYAHNHSFS